MRLALVILTICLLPVEAQAGKWLDYLRKYDLNNYALGLAVTNAQSPYIDTDDSTYAYPYLTSFEHPALTDSWLVIRDGELGLRRILDSGWEFGAFGRMQTLSFGNHDSEALRGVESPKWTIELGPAVGLRRWPVQFHMAAYFEPTDRHDGTTGRFVISYPIKYSRGYVVPHVEAVYEDGRYTNYYYGVTDAEATMQRPSYKPGDALNVKYRVVWGYQINDRWLLSGKLGYESLDENIQRSPLVDRNHIWSANVGLAYNADVFAPASYNSALADTSTFDIRAGIFNTNVDSRIGRETVDGIPGDEIDLEDLLGESDNETVAQIDAIWRVAHFHRLEASYFELVRSGSITLPEEAQIGETSYAAGVDLQSRSHFKSIRVGYAYSLMRDSQKELGVMAGIHFSSFDSVISSMQDDETEESSLDAPLPVFGVHGSAKIGEKTSVAAKIQLFRTDYDNYEGSLNYLTVDVQRRIGKRVNLGLGYNYYHMRLRSSDKELNGYVKITHQGPTLFVGYQF
ncbi:MAG: MipA/OmpV family protein [Woeseiaceae bacterium]